MEAGFTRQFQRDACAILAGTKRTCQLWRSGILRRASGVAMGVLLNWILLVPAIIAAPIGTPAQDDGPPKVNSPWKTWQFNGPPEKVRSELFSLIQEQGLTLTRQDTKEGTFVTDLIEFDDKKFGVDVSVPPPKAGPKYPYFQLNSMTSGKYGLEGRLRPISAEQSRLDLRALLEIRGMDQSIRAMRWVPRISNGEVERFFFTRLAFRLRNSSPSATGK
jgi:hypothetical protein